VDLRTVRLDLLHTRRHNRCVDDLDRRETSTVSTSKVAVCTSLEPTHRHDTCTSEPSPCAAVPPRQQQRDHTTTTAQGTNSSNSGKSSKYHKGGAARSGLRHGTKAHGTRARRPITRHTGRDALSRDALTHRRPSDCAIDTIAINIVHA
jgi:hypothetical protein